MSTDTISRLNREAMALHQSIQRLTRENHELATRLAARTAQCAEFRVMLDAAHTAVLHAKDCTKNREAEIQRLKALQREATQDYIDEADKRMALAAALQDCSESKIPWAGLALGWLAGAATVLIWAFW